MYRTQVEASFIAACRLGCSAFAQDMVDLNIDCFNAFGIVSAWNVRMGKVKVLIQYLLTYLVGVTVMLYVC